MARYARVMWDFQLAQYGYTKRANGLSSTPATIPINGLKSASKDLDIPLNEFWFNFVKDLNPPESKRFITTAHTGWVNDEWAEGEEFPGVESVVMSGNALLIKDTSDNFGLIDSLDFFNDTPDPREVNYISSPARAHKFTVITNRNYIRNPGAGLDAYYPVLRRGESLWISLDRVEFFPELPVAVKVEVPTIINKPFGTTTDRILAAGDTRTIYEYRLSGSSVWASTDDGWIPLLINGVFSPTSWKMNTPPPIAPKSVLETDSDAETLPPVEYEVTVTSIRIIVRQIPGGSKVGELVYGRRARVLQQTTIKGVSWLRIGDKKWITEDGTRRL